MVLTTKPGHNRIRQQPIPRGHSLAAIPSERPYPTAWAYLASRGSGLWIIRPVQLSNPTNYILDLGRIITSISLIGIELSCQVNSGPMPGVTAQVTLVNAMRESLGMREPLTAPVGGALSVRNAGGKRVSPTEPAVGVHSSTRAGNCSTAAPA